MRGSGRNLLIWLSLFLVLPTLAAVRGGPARAGGGGPGEALGPGARVEVDGVGVVAPEPGTTAWGAALRADGESSILGVETREDGTVVIHRAPALVADSGGPAGPAQGACGDGAYSLNGDDWDKSYHWYFNRDSAPSEVDEGRATEAVRDGVENIPQANNDCGLGDKVGATQKYQGTKNDAGNIGSDSTCNGSDGRSMLGFGNLQADDLAFTCWWTRNGAIIEGDIRLNKFEYSWVVEIGGSCVTKYSIEAVVTHEAGHVFGLGHVDEAAHGSLTMSPVMLTCQSSEKTLGLGDVRGLEALY
jgi:hypothetical protein